MTLTRRGLFGSVVALLGARFVRKVAPAPAMTPDRLYSGFMAKSWSNRPSTYKQAREAFENARSRPLWRSSDPRFDLDA